MKRGSGIVQCVHRRRLLVWLIATAWIVAACEAESPRAPALGSGGSAAGGAATGGSGGGATAGQGGAGAAGGPGALDDVCPMGVSTATSEASPRILVLGASSSVPALVAAHLQGLMAADPSFQAPEVVAQETDVQGAGRSLLSFWYAPTDRAARLAKLGGYTWIVLLDDPSVALDHPELHFEGARVVACSARAAGAKPLLLMSWSNTPAETQKRGEIAYRVGNGTGTPVVPAGYAWNGGASTSGTAGAAGSGGAPPGVPAMPDTAGVFVAATSLYTAITGKSADGSAYHPSGVADAERAAMIAASTEAASTHATTSHYVEPFASTVKVQTTNGKTLRFGDAGTSSEAIWHDRIIDIATTLGLTPEGTAFGACNMTKTFDATCLGLAKPVLSGAQFQILFARDYSVSAASIAAAGAQTHLTVQVWDRHYDGLPNDGLAAVMALEERSKVANAQARYYGLAWIPHHLAFAKLKQARPALDLTSDGTHATFPVGYTLASLSIVSRTSREIPTGGLDADTAAGVAIADETVRQLASLSQWSKFIPDDPATRPRARP